MAKKAKSGGKARNIFSTLLIVVGIALLPVAGSMYFRNEQNYREIDEANERIAQYAKLAADDGPPTVDWKALKAVNPDVVGWIQVPGTVVNYPVFQSAHNEYYLHHAPDRTATLGGSVFLDFECKKPGMVDRQSIVYGHHMRNGSQFKQIADMDNQESFDGITTVWYVTENATYELAPLFVYYTTDGDLDVRQFTFDSTKAYREYLTSYYKKAVTQRKDAQEAVKVVDHLFTLSTCNYIDGYGRTLLVCVPKNEIPGTPEYEAVADIHAKQQAQKKKEDKKAREELARRAEEAARAREEREYYEEYYEGEELPEEYQEPLEEEEIPTEPADWVPSAIPYTAN